MADDNFGDVKRAIQNVLLDQDLILIDLEPFELVAERSTTYEQCVGQIDIDRLAVIRAAAADPDKVVIVDPADLSDVQREIQEHNGATSLSLRQQLAAKAFGRVAAYDAVIANWIAQQAGVLIPSWCTFSGKLVEPLRYGENPHQSAAFYRTSEPRFGVATARQVQGKQLSYNNINDTDAAYECVSEFDPKRTAACAIVKHANPCGVAEGVTLSDAYTKALKCDPTSAFGGVVAMNQKLDAQAARTITEIFTEVIIAPDADRDAIALIESRKNLRLLLAGGLPDPRAPGLLVKSVAGGLLVQARDNATVDDLHLTTVTKRAPTDNELADLIFAFRVVKHVKSNAIIYAKDRSTVGIGAGQMSRVDAARVAALKALDATRAAGLHEPLTKGSVAASDAFFPYADGLLTAIDAGVTAVIQPGGSLRDDEVINAANDRNITMVFTGTRHFRH
jgi:phosphoribosylaminoimidazolecarboxamide formyltransferase / IMP cyclohydrolase